MSPRRSTWYQRWNNVLFSTLILSSSLTLKRSWIKVEVENSFVLMLSRLRNHKLYINVEKATITQHLSKIILSTLNQRRNLTLKQLWIWVGSPQKVYFWWYDKLRNDKLYTETIETTLFSWYWASHDEVFFEKIFLNLIKTKLI